jgi:predicted nucleic acid-binding protein
MPDKAFFDTNILIYAFSPQDPRRETALKLLMAGGTISVQGLNEFVNVAARKMKATWTETLTWLQIIQELCETPLPVTMALHHQGLKIAQATGYDIYDSLMLAAALEDSCTIFYSEDMQDGHVIDTLTIQNPFRRKKLH